MVVRTILEWVLQNPLYHIRVWVDAVCLDDCLWRLQEGCATFQWDGQEWRVREEPHAGYTDMFIHTSHEGTVAVGVHVLSALVPLHDPTMLYEEMVTYGNKESAVEVYRTWILHEYGGIFLKPYCRPVGRRLPPVITAPRGLLFGQMTSESDTLGIDDYLVACPAKSLRMQSLCDALHEEYERQVPAWGHGVRHVDQWEAIRLQTFGVYKNWEEHPPDATRIGTHCIQQMIRYYREGKTVNRTGIEKIRDWLSEYEEVDVDTMRKVAFSGSPEHGAIVRGWLESRPEIVALYVFEIQTGYAPIVDEAIKNIRQV